MLFLGTRSMSVLTQAAWIKKVNTDVKARQAAEAMDGSLEEETQ